MLSVSTPLCSFAGAVARCPKTRFCTRTDSLLPLPTSPLPSLYNTHADLHSTAQAHHPLPLPRRCTGGWLRCTRSSLRCAGRSQCHPAVAPALGRDTAVAAAQEGSRQTTRAEQEGGAATCACPHPPRQPCAQGSALPDDSPLGADENGEANRTPHSARLRKEGAGSEAEERQEEDSRRE
jgi:hypothetical protein